jgi:integrase
MATVQKRGKKWYAIYKDEFKHWRQQRGYTDKGQTLKLAQKLEDQALAVATGMVDPDATRRAAATRTSLADHRAAWEQHMIAAGISQGYIAYATKDVERFVEFSGAKTVAEITREAVDRWVIANSEKDSARTLNRRVGCLQAFMKWAMETGAITRYPLYRYPKREIRGTAKRVSRALTGDEMKKLLAWAKKGAADRADLYELALKTGLRADEIEGLTAESFDLKAKTLTVHGKDSRHSDRVDTVPISDTIVKMVERRGANFVLPPRQAEQLREDCIAAGVDPKNVSFHGLRHTFITRLALAGIHPTIVQELARHKDIKMTLSYYTHWQTADKRSALAILDTA